MIKPFPHDFYTFKNSRLNFCKITRRILQSVRMVVFKKGKLGINPLQQEFIPSLYFAANKLFPFSGHDCFHRALIGTTSAIIAKFGVDNIFIFTFGNRLFRAFAFTGTASYTLISNYIRHNSSCSFYNNYFNKIKSPDDFAAGKSLLTQIWCFTKSFRKTN